MLERLFQHIPEGYITIWAKRGEERQTVWFDLSQPDTLQKAQETALQLDADGWDAYFSTCPARAQGGARERIKADGVLYIPAFFTDFDTQLDPAKRGKSLPVDIDAAVGALDTLPCPPTICVCSGHGVHAYWILAEPLRLDTPEDLEVVKMLMSRFAHAVAAATYTALDTGASEPARVLRVPGTRNHKRGDSELVYLVDCPEGPEYTLDELGAFMDAVSTDGAESRKPFVLPAEIPEGARNDTLFRYACSLRARSFEEEAILAMLHDANDRRCLPPLGESDIERIAEQAAKYEAGRSYAGEFSATAEEDFGDAPYIGNALPSYRPSDFTDSGNAEKYARFVTGRLMWSDAAGFLHWDGRYWAENGHAGMKFGEAFARRMLNEALQLYMAASEKRAQLESSAKNTGEGTAKDELTSAKAEEARAAAYWKFALKSRARGSINNFVELAKSVYLVRREDELTADPFLINTPVGIVDFRLGTMRPHDPTAHCTAITSVSPSQQGRALWQDHLRTISCGDAELERFHQMAAGMALIGRVYSENLLIALGGGRNGKSTHYNVQLMVLGHGYAGTLNPEVLTTDKKNAGADLATLKGKRLIIASELEEGKRLSISVLKRLASTDPINAERKFYAPETFMPTHTAILYTNHMPRLGSVDTGTTRRIKVVPFNAVIPAGTEKKNYTQFLFENAGGAILAWMIEGAQMFVADGFQLPTCSAVEEATRQYFADNDWMSGFLEECCVIGKGQTCGTTVLYQAYSDRAELEGDYRRRRNEFAAELEKRGFAKRKTMSGAVWDGLSVRSGWRMAREFRA